MSDETVVPVVTETPAPLVPAPADVSAQVSSLTETVKDLQKQVSDLVALVGSVSAEAEASVQQSARLEAHYAEYAEFRDKLEHSGVRL
jgi:hypothetical protein